MNAVEVILLCVLVISVFGVTARLALPPTVDAIVRIHEIFVQTIAAHEIEARVVVLEDEVRRLRLTVQANSPGDGQLRDGLGRDRAAWG